MVRSIFFLMALGFLSACSRKEPVETKEAMKKRLDSMSAERIRQIDQRYHRDLHYRMKIEAIEKEDTTAKTPNPTGSTNL